MKPKMNERRIILLIRYSLPILILITTFFIAVFLSNEHKKNIEQEKRYIEKQYIKDQKEQVKSDLERVYIYLEDKNHDVINDLKKSLKSRVENIYSIINSIYTHDKDMKTKEEIFSEIKEAIRDIRFNGNKGYFFIYTLSGDVILNPVFPKLEGKNLWNYKDAKGTFLLQEMNKILSVKNETFYDWYWKDPEKDPNKQFLKIGFFKKFEPYGIFVGTGYYLDDHIDNLKSELISYISKLRYKDDRYIFVVDDKNNLIVNKHQSLLNQNINSEKLNHLKENIVKLRGLKGEEGVFLKYQLLLDGKEPIEKTSYFLRFEPWDWIIGTGFTMESANKVIKEKQNFLISKYKEYLNNIYVIGFVFLVALLIISYFVSKFIEKSFFNYTTSLEEKQKLLLKSQKIAHLGDWNLDINSMEIYWADTIYEIFGIEDRPEKITLEFFKNIMYEDDWKCFDNSLKLTILNKSEHSCTYRIKKADGSIRWIDCRGEFEPQTNKLIGIIQDITLRKEFEIDKERKEKILYQQSKMAAMGEMIGNIAHQ